PFLARIFPDAQFLHIIRDGRDVALSYSKKPWLQAASAGCGRYEPGGYPYGPYPRFWVEPERAEEFQTTSDIHRCVWAWRRYTESILEAAQDLPTDRYHELRYETMVRMPEDEALRILDFLEISRPESRRGFERAMAQAKGGSVGRWQQEIPPSDLARIETEAGSLLRRLGYAG
ncbi:MAG TPA: sulfotransferase, partial [Trueperaceae bacterium]